MQTTTRMLMIVLLTSLGLASDARAQGGERASFRRWSVTLYGGWTEGRSPKSVEEAMLDAGLNEVSPARCFWGLCAPSQRHPRSIGRTASRALAVSYALKRGLRVRALWATAEFGETVGWRDDGSEWGADLALHQEATTVAALVALSVEGAARVAVGPSLNFVELGDAGTARSTATKPGLVCEAALSLPARSRFFVEAAVQYRYVVPAELGPFYARSGAWPGEPEGEGATFPTSRIEFSQAVLNLGMGVRF